MFNIHPEVMDFDLRLVCSEASTCSGLFDVRQGKMGWGRESHSTLCWSVYWEVAGREAWAVMSEKGMSVNWSVMELGQDAFYDLYCSTVDL